MPIVLYQPTEQEIRQVIDRGKVKHPGLPWLYDDAAQLLHLGALGYAFESWYCLSQSKQPYAYRIQDGACNCPSYEKAQFQIQGRIFCKHLVGYYALLKILTAQFNARWIGTTANTSAIERYRSQPNTWLLKHAYSPAFNAWTGEQGQFVCFGAPIAPSSQQPAQAPANPYQFAQFSAWLAQAQPLSL